MNFDQALLKANSLHMKGEVEQAEALYQELICHAPNHPFVLFSLGTLYADCDRPGLALPLIMRACDLDPGQVQYWNNLGATLRTCEHHEDAIAVLEKALELKSDNAPTYANLSGCYINRGQPDRAIYWARKGLAIDPEQAQCGNHLGLALLERGDWAEGWDAWEARKRLPGWHNRELGCPVWDGSPVGTLAVTGEQGIGDEILFLSVLPDAISRSSRVVVECDKRLIGLVERSFPGVKAYGTEAELKAAERVDAHISLGSLPRLFRRKQSDCPGAAFLEVDPERAAYWRERLEGTGPGPYVGLAWTGGTKRTHGQYRRTLLSDWKPILDQPARFISVQYGNAAPDAIANGVVHWPEAVQNFDDHTALIAACDLVITVCQTAVHQAGALGIPTWVLTPDKPAWRYGIKGSRMPWYNSARLYRQAKGATWQPVIKEISRDLADFVRVSQAQRRTA